MGKIKKPCIFLIFVIILLSLVINNSILLYVTNIENHSESNVEKGDHYKLIAHDYYVSFVNTVVVINDSFSVYGCLKIINSTLIFNTTRDRIITIYCYCDNVIMENSILKTVDRNVSFFKIMFHRAVLDLMSISIINSTLINGILSVSSNCWLLPLNITNSRFYKTDFDIALQPGNLNPKIIFYNNIFHKSTLSLFFASNVSVTDMVFFNSTLFFFDSRLIFLENLTLYQTREYEDKNLLSFIGVSNITFRETTIFGNGSFIKFQNCINVTFEDNLFYKTSISIDYPEPTFYFKGDNYINDKPIYFYHDVSDVYLNNIDAGEIIVINGNNIVIDDVRAGSILLLNTSNSLVVDSLIENGGFGIYILMSSEHSIEHNTIHTAENGIITCGSNTTILSNTISDVTIGIEAYSGWQTISENTIFDVKKGILIRSGDHITISDNKIYSADEGGIVIDHEYGDMSYFKIISNNLTNCGLYISVPLQYVVTYKISDNKINNNLIPIYINVSNVNLINYTAIEALIICADNVTILNSSFNSLFLKDIKSLTISNSSIIDNSPESSGYEYGVYIKNVENVTIESLKITNAKIGITIDEANVNARFVEIEGRDIGIYLLLNAKLNMTFSKIIKSKYGILNEKPSYIFLRECNFIQNLYAMYFKYNVKGYVFLNNFINNTYQVVSETSLSELKFNRKFIGNYWSDYKGADNNKNNIGDSVHMLGYTFNDSYPLMKPVCYEEEINSYMILILDDYFFLDTKQKFIVYVLNFILNRDLLTEYIFRYEIGNKTKGVYMVLNSTSFMNLALLPIFPINTTIRYWVDFHYNGSWYSMSKREFTFTQESISPPVPQIENITFPSEVYENQTVTIYAKITDDLGITKAQVRFLINSDWVNKDMDYDNNTGLYYVTFSKLKPRIFRFKIYAENPMKISKLTEEYEIIVRAIADTIPPEIISVYWTPTEPIKNETVFVYVTVSDNVGIANVTAVLNTSGSKWTEKLLSYGNGTYCLVLTELGDIDSVSFYIIVYDLSGNFIESNKYTISFKELEFESIPTQPDILTMALFTAVSFITGAVSVIAINYLRKRLRIRKENYKH
ncbi:MAG: right-handed parallel beta-helix repeat-containing protein [Candidatus Asgardarchaeum sp.]